MNQRFESNDRVGLDVDDDGVARVRLTRADKLNALDLAMFDGLIAAGHALHETRGLRAVILSGEGEGFCAGLDLGAMAGLSVDGLALTDRTHGKANRFQQAAMLWRTLPVPVVAAIHGVCFGGGLQIVAGADIRVAAPDARLSIMEMKWGIVPDMGGFALWRGSVRQDLLRELTYTNREFSGEEAQRMGFATLVDADPLARATAIAREIAGKSPTAIRAAKSLFNRSQELTLEQILMEESIEQQRLIGAKNQLEAVLSQQEGRKGRFVDP